ncbi:MAG: family 16 glycoside hydrolase [Rubripirellula sp.]
MIPNLIGQSISSRFFVLFATSILSCVFVAATFADEPATKEKPVSSEPKADKDKKDKAGNWKPLQGSWVVSQFGGDGPAEIKDNSVKIGFGDPLTGIRWEGELPRENFEVELEAKRTEGFDFFCALTFPVGENNVSFILGGWGGGVVGISSVDGFDASENDTTTFRNFDNDRWYKVRARVDAHQIQCWIDDKAAAEQVRQGHEFDIRYEMDQCVPLGVAAFQCKSEMRNMRIRKLDEKEIEAANAAVKAGVKDEKK